MPSCLGMYVQDNLIKYAKVSKDHDKIKVDSFGVKFYENINEAIKQVVEETYSYKTPISINLEQEIYNYFDMFALLNKTDLQKAIKTEFDAFCQDKGYNPNAFEKRSAVVPNIDDKQKLKVIHVSENKIEFSKMLQLFSGYKLAAVSPISMTISNLKEFEPKQNYLIVNIEDQTTVTTIIDQQIYNIETIPQGSKEFLEKLNMIENSYSKAYEICKNSTIYTMETTEGTGNNEYLQYIVPTLYKIVQEIQKIKERFPKIDNIYLTGMGTVINNIDLYFKEYFKESKVEILKPFFLEDKMNINIKDYIEVNSAIALALQGLGLGIKNLNFMKRDWKTELKTLLSSDVNMKDIKMPKFNFKLKNKNVNLKSKVDLSGELDRVERLLLRDCAVVLIVIIMYSVGSSILVKQINAKIKETDDVTLYANSQLSLANSDSSKVNERTKDYQKYKTNLENVSSAIETKRSRKNQITTMLNKIVYNIPKEVQLTEIKNTETTDSGKTVQHIIIHAQSTKYEQLAYFKAKMKNANVLDNITSTEGQKDGEYVKIIIEGDLKTY